MAQVEKEFHELFAQTEDIMTAFTQHIQCAL
ncbi:hypothetical protein F7D09_1812 [Bifidobacterium leontopitheci]|uniref:Uncharacterized protein n=1 Tax=Bifidobacterium leontopitheci TaxID=2650774 RepID=A0A6I1GNP0_9BIFI|nr:hypothetical protein F7D09_1812 [Bifidobacterium leontopitheci]